MMVGGDPFLCKKISPHCMGKNHSMKSRHYNQFEVTFLLIYINWIVRLVREVHLHLPNNCPS